MAIKDMLVILENGKEEVIVNDYALSLAAAMGAHLTAAGIAIQAIAPVSFMGDYPYDLMAQAAEEMRAAGEAAFARLRAAAPANVTVEYVAIEGFSGEAMDRTAGLARHFDLSILRQSAPEEDGQATSTATAVLFGSGRPAVILPYIHRGPARLGKAMVAWDGGAAASRAIAGAMPLLKKAGHVEVVTVAARGADGDDMPGFNITRHLARHGVNAELRILPPGKDIAALLLSHAADSRPDYIVMGCYGHSRLRELVLGGTTRDILGSMTVPLVMAH